MYEKCQRQPILTGITLHFCTKLIPKELWVETLAYLCMVCSVSLKNLRKLDEWKTKEDVAGLKHYLQQINSIWKSVLKNYESKVLLNRSDCNLELMKRNIFSTTVWSPWLSDSWHRIKNHKNVCFNIRYVSLDPLM